MQPPETEPIMLPSPSTASWLPTGRGDEPQVLMTVASVLISRFSTVPFEAMARGVPLLAPRQVLSLTPGLEGRTGDAALADTVRLRVAVKNAAALNGTWLLRPGGAVPH